MTSNRPLIGRSVAITGAARGIGLSTANALSAAGARVILGDLGADEQFIAPDGSARQTQWIGVGG